MKSNIRCKDIKEFITEVMDINEEQLKDAKFFLMKFNEKELCYDYLEFDLEDNLKIADLIGSEEDSRFENPTNISCRYFKPICGVNEKKIITINQKNCTYYHEEPTFFKDRQGKLCAKGIKEHKYDLSLQMREKFVKSVEGYADALKTEIEEEYKYWINTKVEDWNYIKMNHKTNKFENTKEFYDKLDEIKAEKNHLLKLIGSQLGE